MEIEENWFVSDWFHEPETEKVAIVFSRKPRVKFDLRIENAKVTIVKNYLVSIGFKLDDSEVIDSSPRSRRLAQGMKAFVVDLVNRNFIVTDAHVVFHIIVQNNNIRRAKPSQIPIFLETRKGRLTGKKFGL